MFPFFTSCTTPPVARGLAPKAMISVMHRYQIICVSVISGMSLWAYMFRQRQKKTRMNMA